MGNGVCIFGTLSFACLFGFVSYAGSASMVASNFLAHVGMETGSDIPVQTDWNMAESITVSNAVFAVASEKHSKTYYGLIVSSDNVPVGRFEVNISRSESGARLFWGVRQTSRPLPPNLYYDNYSIHCDSRGFISVWETSVDDMNVTNRIQDHVSLLYKNISIDLESNRYSPEELALALLRAGGVEIPAGQEPPAPEPTPLNPEPTPEP